MTALDYSLYDKIDKINGWLNRVTGIRTMEILEWQSAQGNKGDLLEIGVFCGKYFSLLVDAARRHDCHALGIDTFEFAPPQRVTKEMTQLFGNNAGDRFTLWKRPSSTVTALEVNATIRSPRFISVDGAHDYGNVYRDLLLAEAVLSPGGIVAADDFLNPLTLGVNQAINHFLSQPRAVVPVAFIANKLFLAHRSMESEYRTAIEELIVKGAEPQSVNFRRKMTHGRHHVEQDFYGHKVLIS